ncbi:MAG: hypothetical protein AAFP79_04900 [Pseudomonadota bacterium]
MSTSQLLRKAADLLEVTPISQNAEDRARLMTFHVLRIVDDHGHEEEEALILSRLPE